MLAQDLNDFGICSLVQPNLQTLVVMEDHTLRSWSSTSRSPLGRLRCLLQPLIDLVERKPVSLLTSSFGVPLTSAVYI